jgi:hypothetical protein
LRFAKNLGKYYHQKNWQTAPLFLNKKFIKNFEKPLDKSVKM